MIQVVVVIGVLLSLCASTFHSVLATGETITGSNSFTTELKTAGSIGNITIDGTGNDTIQVKLLVTNGSLAMSVTTGLTFKNASGSTISNPQTGSTLYFSGTRSDVNAALATLTYTRNNTGTDTLEVSLVPPGEVFFSGNNHLYEYVASTLTWGSAKTAAESRSKYGATGYLATITSQEENDFVAARLTNAGWMGASDVATEGVWKWVTGPENGTTFSNGNSPNMVAASGQYQNWNTGEPNDSSGNEDCGQFLSGGTGKWNDLPCTGTSLPGYVVEYGAPGNLPMVTAKNISITTSDTVAPTVPGIPSASNPTTNQKPTWSWTGSTDGGTGLANPAYTVQWSQSSSFSSGVSSATVNSTSYTHSVNLSDGTWYFRVRANDSSGNSSSYSSNGTVLVDTTAPTAPDIGATTISTRFTPSVLSWNPSTDGGTGLANPAYTVQWSQSSSFSSGVSSATTNTTSYTTTTLAQGTWYFRIRAADAVANNSLWSNTVTIVYDTTAPTTPGAPSTTTPTNNTLPSWSWGGSSDAGSGLDSPAYTVEWSQSSSFSSGVNSATTNLSTFAHTAGLSDGTWYFRIKATDVAGNDSLYSSIGSVVVDTAAPEITTIDANSVTPTSQTITWVTDKLSSSQINYGPTSAYDTASAVYNISPRVTNHAVVLSNLVPCTLYHYEVTSVDALTNSATSTDSTFITSGCAGASSVIAHTDSVVSMNNGGDLSLSSAGDVITISVPAHFASTDANFQIKKLEATTAFGSIGTPTGLSAIGGAYDIKAMQDTTTAISNFNGEVTVTMNYSANDALKFIESSFVIYRWDDGPGWQKLNNCSVNTADKTVTCTTPGFSTFGLFGQVVPPALSTENSQINKASRQDSTVNDEQSSTEGDTLESGVGVKVPQAGRNVLNSAATTTRKQSDKTRYIILGTVATMGGIFWWFIAVKRRSRKDQDSE